jgi:hypothetical protein
MGTTPIAAPAVTAESIYSAATSAADTGSTSTETAPATQETAAEIPVAPVEGEQPVDAAAIPPEVIPEVTEEDLEFEPEIKPDVVSEDGKILHFRAPKAHKLLAAQAFQRSIQEEIPGATVDDVKVAYRDAVTMRQMVDDFDSGDPARVNNFVNFWLDPKNMNPASVGLMAERLVNDLPQYQPQVYAQMEKSVLSRTAQTLYQQAHASKDDALFTLAQHIDKMATGKWVEAGDFAQRDPAQERVQSIEQENQKLRETLERQHAESMRQRESQIQGTLNGVMAEEIEKALSPWAAAFKDKPQWEYMKRELADAIETTRRQSASWMREFENERRATLNRPSEEAIGRLVARQRNLVKTVLARHRNDVAQRHTGQLLTQSVQAHAKLQAASATGTDPVGGTAATSASSVVDRARQMRLQGASAEDIFRMTLSGSV